MSDERAWLEASELLRAIGEVRQPAPRVLEHAREVLWSAVTGEMPAPRPAGEQAGTARRRQAGQPRDERRMSMGGADQG